MKTTAFVCCLLIPGSAFAIGVTPTRIIFDAGNRDEQTLHVHGNQKADVAVEMSIMERTPERKAQASPFLAKQACIELSLPQTLIETGESQALKVRSRTSEDCYGRSYYVVIETLPINLSNGDMDTQIRIASRFLVPVHFGVSDPEKAEVILAARGRALILTNPSPAPILLSELQLELLDENSDAWVTVTGSELAERINSDALIANEERVLNTILWGENAQFVDVRLSTE